MSDTDYTKIPGLTADGKPWWKLCYVCKKSIDLIKTPKCKIVSIGDGMIRHKKCDPNILKDLTRINIIK